MAVVPYAIIRMGNGFIQRAKKLKNLLLSSLHLLPRGMVRPFAMRYIAGERLADAVAVVKGLNSRGITATVDVLGENVATREESARAVQAAADVLLAIRENRLSSTLSIKLTQFGIKIDEGFCFENVKTLLATAARFGIFVRIDMEDSSVTEITLKFYERLCADGLANVGMVIQAYLRRSAQDLRRLAKLRPNVRLVKGIYLEPESIAFQDPEEIRGNYSQLLEMLFDGGSFVGIATHDDRLIGRALASIRKRSLGISAYEFQMLYGVRPGLRDRLVAEGHRMRVYVPFGPHWYAYSMRRFKENPQILHYVLRGLFTKDS